MGQNWIDELGEKFRTNLAEREPDYKIRKACEKLYMIFSDAVASDEYQGILKNQNKRWKEISRTQSDITPAAGLNFKMFSNHLKKAICKRFKIDDESFNGEYLVTPELDVLLYDERPSFIIDMPTFTPNDSDEICENFVWSNKDICDFVTKTNDEYLIFDLEPYHAIRFMFFDIVFTAMDPFFNHLPKENKIDENYTTSLYVNPEFLYTELSHFFTFLSDIKQNNTRDIQSRQNSNLFVEGIPSNLRKSTKFPNYNQLPKENKNDENYSTPLHINPKFIYTGLSHFFTFLSDIKQKNTRDIQSRKNSNLFVRGIPSNLRKSTKFPNVEYPLPTECKQNLSTEFESLIYGYRGSDYSSKIMKSCYPLFFFVYNNILFYMLKEDGPRDILSVEGCKFIGMGDKWDFSSIKKAMELSESKIRSYTNKIQNKKGIDLLYSQIYALNQFRCYIDSTFLSGTTTVKEFRFSYKYKRGNNLESKIALDLPVNFNSALTTWLFIKHSDLFKVILMTRIEKILPSEEQALDSLPNMSNLFPPNFLTAFCFSSRVFQNYPSFFYEYSNFIQKMALKFQKAYPKYEFKEWLDIVNCIDSTFPSDDYELICLRRLIDDFFNFIEFKVYECNDRLPKFTINEPKFYKYLKISRAIEKENP